MNALHIWKKPLLTAGLLAAVATTTATPARASDHGDTAENIARIGTDLTDLYIFPSPQNSGNVVLAMDVRGLIPAGQAARFSFDPGVLYQFKIDNTGDAVEDLVIQARFEGTGANQRAFITGPVRPSRTGNTSIIERNTNSSSIPSTPRSSGSKKEDKARQQRPAQGQNPVFVPLAPAVGFINRTFSPTAGTLAFAGVREDPFFFDLDRFYQIFPDRITPIQPPLRTTDINTPNPNAPRVNGFRPPGQARDYFRNINVLSIIVELPRTSLLPRDADGNVVGNGQIGVWMTTSVPNGTSANSSNGNRPFIQQDRLARPAINEVLATVSNNRHKVNNRIVPTQDGTQLASDIRSFYTFPAGRSAAITNVAVAVLVPDVMKVDLSQGGPAAYLGVETGGATGGKFGGRKLSDDVVDIDLGAIFGNTISALGLAPDDGNAKPQFASDNVGFQGNELSTFPYLPNPA
jgi:hypothetical protein